MEDLNGLQLNNSDFSMGDESFWQEYLDNEPNNVPGGGISVPDDAARSETGSRTI
jgi:hypothetical protein